MAAARVSAETTKLRTTKAEATSAPRRPYRSRLREQRAAETRAALVEAAHRLFVGRGWFATGMRDVATEAGVALETVYAHFPSKRALLRAVLDIAVAGDDRPVAVAGRPEFAAIGRGTHPQRCAAAAKLLADIYRRTAAVARVIREAAASDEELAVVLATSRKNQRRDVAAAAKLIMGREPSPFERDGLWALTSPENYLLLVHESGWSDDQYEAWMAETLSRVTPRAPRAKARQ